MTIVVDDSNVMMLCAGEDQEVCCRHREALAASQARDILSEGPDLRRRGERFDLTLQLAKQPLLSVASGAVPQLEAHHVAQHSTVISRDVADPRADLRIAVRPERLDPSGGIDKEPLARAQGSSRIRRNSSCVMNPSRVPNLSTSF